MIDFLKAAKDKTPQQEEVSILPDLYCATPVFSKTVTVYMTTKYRVVLTTWMILPNNPLHSSSDRVIGNKQMD